MDARVAIKDNPTIAITAAILVIVLALAAIISQLRNNGHAAAPPRQMYFTVDDGASYFADDIGLAPPITRDGKVMLRAYVFKGASGKPWVQYLGRYKPAAKARIEKLAQQKGIQPQDLVNALGEGVEVKPPLTGDTGWVDMYSQRGLSICEVHRPPGVSDPFEPLYP